MLGRGVPYAVVTACYDPEVHRGVPKVLFELDGARLYDPRQDSSVGGAGPQRWSDPSSWTPFGGGANENPVVQIYNLMLGLARPGHRRGALGRPGHRAGRPAGRLLVRGDERLRRRRARGRTASSRSTAPGSRSASPTRPTSPTSSRSC